MSNGQDRNQYNRSLRGEFVQFEKRFESFTTGTGNRFDRIEKKVDQIPWLLLGIVVNLLLSAINFVG